MIKNDIMQLLRWRRKAYSDTLKQFIKHYMGQWDLEVDGYGNLYKRIGTTPVMWSCHLDTVHRKEGWQNVRIDSEGIIRQKGMKSRCLGADDGAGIWLLLEMLDRGVEGLYIFHLDEEVGGKGSSWIASFNETLLDGIKYAIAFDRKSDHSIITNQWGVCCSDTFGESLAKELGLGHVLDTTGRFTDTDNYKEIIPECTNVSVGYYDEHKPQERLDFKYLERLRDALVKLDVNNLVEQRKPHSYVYGTGRRASHTHYSGGYNYQTGMYDTDYWDEYNEGVRRAREAAAKRRGKETADAEAKSKIIPISEPKTIVRPGLGADKYIVKPGSTTVTNLENIERLCSLNARKMARVLLDAGATYQDVLNAFLNLDVSKPNVARADANADGWLSMIAKFILGGK